MCKTTAIIEPAGMLYVREIIDRMLSETLTDTLGLQLDPTATAANTPRNSKFERAAKLWLKGKTCIVCGGVKDLRCHHKFPFHLFRSLEMDERYWRPVCQGNPALNCHLAVAHLGNFEAFNPLLDEIAGLLRFGFQFNRTILHAIHAETKRKGIRK